MGNDAFDRLAPFIQEYIYSHGWTELRQVQAEACRVIFDTDAHLLIAAGTASGKTEAAFLPVLTRLYAQPARTIAALYIGPIKALINDQFDRLNDLLKQADIPVWAWHGDVGQAQKQRLLKDPRGILQITPESLESLLINKSNDLMRLFAELQFVVIDEVHAFVGSDRGWQILCQLVRLAKQTGCNPRRIGLSATLGDYGIAETWLQAGTDRTVITPIVQGGQRKLHLALEHFQLRRLGVVRAKGETPTFDPYYQHIFDQTRGRKCLIFANSRPQAESITANLREMAQANHMPDIYHVHHGSIAAPLREAAENAMRGETPAITAATLTFELGIDIGQLERVIQLESPLAVASFLQRLGRTGRRGTPADMRFVCAEPAPTGDELLPEQIPWQLLQCIAILQLYLEEKWVEPARSVQYPFSLLYHQTLSTLAALGELSPVALAQQVLTLPPFRQVSQEDFRQLLRHLLDLDHLQRTETGGLLIGLQGEKIVRNFKFYAIFPDTEDYQVMVGTEAIGSIVTPPPPGSRFALAGRTWEVLDLDTRRKRVLAQPAIGTATVSWHGGGGEIHTRVLQRMRQVLVEQTEYAYLQPGARKRLQAARKLAEQFDLEHNAVIPLEDRKACCVLPWMGTVPFRTLERFVSRFCRETIGLRSVTGTSPYYLMVQLGKAKPHNLYYEIVSAVDRRLTSNDLMGEEEAPKLQKYDEFVPSDLLRKAFAYDYLNLEELRGCLSSWPPIEPSCD
ncbi:ATP-dependent helicase [Leptolyngbya sp. 'hensonii']|uniref:DEAD/DEAH box helicase n=1 Tax=Leptolyngbya sp. 'hensonii' TaxID=1922337 RepID=UPI00094F8EA2|nr:DEAD/DEAH box helicase [Leptolyngbya sp. 'hensonii']OLP18472.1 ATP-dependent helicase [Leptolyngbya sp. 'hensonii']